ncbi:MAG TPA: CHRD domain-containing protein [Terracidiphilus sp.]|nr:CHRD domain-containing protein [Terracidiphilus sp.]
MKKAWITAAARSLAVIAVLFAYAWQPDAAGAQDWDHAASLSAELISLNQVPAVLTQSHGNFSARINEDGTITYELSYAGMSSAVTQAHIHFGASKTNGGVAVFLCGGPKPACPASGTVTGTITAADVSVLPATNGDSVIPQGITPGDMAGLLTAIRTGNAYVNVHTAMFPSGEIRGQIHMR